MTFPPMPDVMPPDFGAAMTIVCFPPAVLVTFPMADLAMLSMLLGTVLMMVEPTLPWMPCDQRMNE